MNKELYQLPAIQKDCLQVLANEMSVKMWQAEMSEFILYCSEDDAKLVLSAVLHIRKG